jgi:hypothetical protein
VGITTADPDAGLHVNSNAYVHTDFRVGSGIVMNDITGQITAGSFVGDGSGLDGINSDSGSWVNGTGNVYLSTTTDKVGIGTTSPDKLLHVETPVNTSENLVKIGSYMNNGSRSVSGIEFATNPQFWNGDNGQRVPAKIKSGFYGDGPLVANWADAFITLQTTSGSGGAMVDNLVCRGGNVGIGTTNPGRPLDVQFTGDTGIRAKNTGSTHASVYIDSASGYSYLRFQSGGAEKFWLQSTPTGDLAFRPSGSGHVMDIKNNGNVGIGTSDPNHKLEVSGGILADYVAIPEINLYGARIGHVIEYRYSGMPSSAPTDESSMNLEFGQRHSSSIASNTQMRYPYGTSATNIGRMWIGIIQATSTGVYTFGVNSDDAGDLFVAGYRVADWYSGHGHNSTITIPGGNQRTIYLKGGQWYKVKARFEENSGGEAFFALWKKPGDTSFSEIPSGNLAYILSDFSSAPTSDDRIKVNETMISNATDTIIKLKPQIYDKFEFIEDVHDTKNKPIRESGLIAQDIWYDTPELRHIVYPYKTPNETREVNEDIQQDPDYSDWGPVAAQVNYFGVIPYLIKSFQELHENVTSERVKTQEMKEDLQTTRTDLQTTRTQLNEDLQTTRTQLNEDLQTTRTDLQTTRTDLQTTRTDLQTTRTQLETIRTELEQALQAEKEKTKTLESRLAFLETAVASLIS